VFLSLSVQIPCCLCVLLSMLPVPTYKALSHNIDSEAYWRLRDQLSLRAQICECVCLWYKYKLVQYFSFWLWTNTILLRRCLRTWTASCPATDFSSISRVLYEKFNTKAPSGLCVTGPPELPQIIRGSSHSSRGSHLRWSSFQFWCTTDLELTSGTCEVCLHTL
jgi:hypothetical protein